MVLSEYPMTTLKSPILADLHIATKGGAVTVGYKHHIPVVKIGVKQLIVAKKSKSKVTRRWPFLR